MTTYARPENRGGLEVAAGGSRRKTQVIVQAALQSRGGIDHLATGDM